MVIMDERCTPTDSIVDTGRRGVVRTLEDLGLSLIEGELGKIPGCEGGEGTEKIREERF